MDGDIKDLWYIPIVRGISAIGFAILLLVWPVATISVIAFSFAALFTVYAVMDVIVGIQGLSKGFSSILRVLLGFLELAIVVYIFKNAGSGVTLAVMGLLMAISFMVFSVLLIASALLSDASAGYRWAIGIAGVATLLVAVSVARLPAISVTTLIYTLGVFGLFIGPIEIASGIYLKRQAA